MAFLALPAVSLLAACGGSSTSSSGSITTPPPTVTYTTLRAFSDGAGVGRGVASDGTETVFIAPDIAEVVAIANQNDPVSDIQFSDFAVVDTRPTAVIRQGTITIEGQVANVTIIADNGGEAGLIYLDIPGYGDAVFAAGSAFGTAPNGSFTYNGVHVVADRFFGGSEDGTFSLTADFNNQTFSYNGSTLSSSLSGSGTIDTVNGRFSSNTLSSNVGSDTGTASMYGQLHGNSAQSVSGVFHTNESDPFYAGAFVGSRP
ncbi:MAG: hypothetical protein ACNA7O_12060 [Rhodobacterales bacterium]